MIDPTVERQYSDCKELIALWKTFSEFFAMGVKGENITPEKEDQFMKIKSRVAELHDSFMDALTHDQNIGQGMLDIVSRSITLKHVGRLSTADVKKMEIEWHESYLLVNDTIAQLEDKRNELAPISETQFRTKQAAGAVRQKVMNFFTSAGFKLAVGLLVFFFCTVGIQMMGIFDWDTVGNWKWAHTPYRWGKGLVRTMEPESPWPNIDVVPRKPYGSWPSGVKPPENKSADKSALVKIMPVPSIREKVGKATQYRMETTEEGFKGQVEIHSALMPDTKTAKDMVTEWKNFMSSPGPAKAPYQGKMAVFNDHNLVTVVKGDNADLVNNINVNVYKQNTL